MAARVGLPPGPRYPRALQTLGWGVRPMAFMERCHARYGDMFTLRIAQEGTWVLLADPDLVKQVFTGDPSVLHAGEGNVVLLPVVGRHSVLLLDDAEHMRQRKLLLPAFHGERMQRYGELMTRIAEEEIARWPVGEPLALWPRMQAITLEIILRAVFGVDEGERLERMRRRVRELLELTTDPLSMLVLALVGPRKVGALGPVRRRLATLDGLIYDEIRLRRADPDVGERDDILSLLVQATDEAGEPMSERELRDELVTLLVAGHATTATSLAWAVERMVRHPDKLVRLTEEVEASADVHSGGGEYLDAVIKETLRLRPVIPIVVRRLTQPLEIGGYVLPAGASVTPCVHLIHRRADIYPEPRAFRPERFLERPAGTYTWIPFGGGVRRCLGASFAQFEMQMVLSALVRETRLRPAQPAGERVGRRAITLVPSRGASVVVERRGRAGARVPAVAAEVAA
jgi:cytochrome P450 family 135